MDIIENTYKQVLELFSFSGERFVSVVRSLSESQINLPTAPGEWTIRQVVHHVTDDTDVWSINIKKAIAASGAIVRFEGYPGNDAWAESLNFADREVQTALDLLEAHHTYLVSLLKNFPHAWEHNVVIINEEGVLTGRMTVREIIQMLVDHLLEHLDAIESALARQKRT
jgi:hypothetical protein